MGYWIHKYRRRHILGIETTKWNAVLEYVIVVVVGEPYKNKHIFCNSYAQHFHPERVTDLKDIKQHIRYIELKQLSWWLGSCCMLRDELRRWNDSWSALFTKVFSQGHCRQVAGLQSMDLCKRNTRFHTLDVFDGGISDSKVEGMFRSLSIFSLHVVVSTMKSQVPQVDFQLPPIESHVPSLAVNVPASQGEATSTYKHGRQGFFLFSFSHC